jgi:hypothetical protein
MREFQASYQVLEGHPGIIIDGNRRISAIKIVINTCKVKNSPIPYMLRKSGNLQRN